MVDLRAPDQILNRFCNLNFPGLSILIGMCLDAVKGSSREEMK
jgi:hypothetical protein